MTRGTPSTHALHTDLSRHDHHRVEIKTVMDLSSDDSAHLGSQLAGSSATFRSQMNVYLFMPKSVHLTSWPKSDLITDFHSHVRLSVPLHSNGGQSVLEDTLRHLATARSRFLEHRASMDPNLDPLLDTANPFLDELIAAAKELAAVVGETIKRYKAEHGKALSEILSSQVSPEKKIAEIETIIFSIEAVATMTASVRNSMGTLDETTPSVLRLLDEFISSLYIQYLGKIRSRANRSRSPKVISPLQAALDRLQTIEADHRNRFHPHLSQNRTERELEHEMARLSQLKKFFQSSLFFDVTYHEAAKALNQPIAAGAAALAALWAIMFQQFNTPMATDIGLKGVSFISLGIFAYVLKDRLKDWVKDSFAARASRIFPDIEQQLFADRQNIGTIQEWFRTLNKTDIPIEVDELRTKASLSEVERSLPEDVFHYRRNLELKAYNLKNLGSAWGIRENLRINLERYLRHMDDPFKDISFLDNTGRLTKRKSHRVYHFYACVRLGYATSKSSPASSTIKKVLNDQEKYHSLTTTIYRIVMDKNGVDRIEPLALPVVNHF